MNDPFEAALFSLLIHCEKDKLPTWEVLYLHLVYGVYGIGVRTWDMELISARKSIFCLIVASHWHQTAIRSMLSVRFIIYIFWVVICTCCELGSFSIRS